LTGAYGRIPDRIRRMLGLVGVALKSEGVVEASEAKLGCTIGRICYEAEIFAI
jgi:hypothetical protein